MRYSIYAFLFLIITSSCQLTENDEKQEKKIGLANDVNSNKGKEYTRAKEGENTLLIINYIKDESKTDYENFMNDIFFDLLLKSKEPLMKEQYHKTRWLSPARQNQDGTWTYAFFMDPVVEGGNYEFAPLFEEKYSEEESAKLVEQHESFMALPPQFHSLVQTRH